MENSRLIHPSFYLWFAGWNAAKSGKNKTNTLTIVNENEYVQWLSGWNAWSKTHEN